MTFDVDNISDLEAPAKWILTNYPAGGIFFLRGDLASGKTTFVKTFAGLLGFKDASSPTFALINDYGGKIYHYDIYQLSERKISLFEIAHNLLEPGWHFVEWANYETVKIADILGVKPIWNDFCISEGKRQIKIG